jgi:hypothetical protein
MVKYMIGFALALALPVGEVAMAQTIGVPDPQQAAIDALVRSLIAVMDEVPKDSPKNVYAAEFSLRVDRAGNLECPKVLKAIGIASMSPKMNAASLSALKSLGSTLTICKKGTGSGPAGLGQGLGPLPGFSLGGGTDYTN